jgi:hypothetical protein
MIDKKNDGKYHKKTRYPKTSALTSEHYSMLIKISNQVQHLHLNNNDSRALKMGQTKLFNKII